MFVRMNVQTEKPADEVSPAVPIGIAVVLHEGRCLVGRRGPEGPLPGYREFPGGKCRPGESPRDCACRECREETGLKVTAVERLDCTTFAYPHATVELHFWRCRPAAIADVCPSHSGYVWVDLAELASLKFPPANAGVLERLLRLAGQEANIEGK